MAPPLGSNPPDYIVWNTNSDGVFTICEACTQLAKELRDSDIRLFDFVWRWNGPQHIRIILWKIAKGILPRNGLIGHRHMALDILFPLCHDKQETTLHCLRDCSWVCQVRSNLWYGNMPAVFFFQDNLCQWLELNLRGGYLGRADNWSVLFGVALDRIWWRRNSFAFKHT